MEIFPGISVDAGVRFGKPCIAGTRIDIAMVIGALAGGESFEDVERDYGLTHHQVLAALRYAAHVAATTPRLSSAGKTSWYESTLDGTRDERA